MKYLEQAEFIASQLLCLDMPERIKALNEVRQIIAKASPFNLEPVDCVIWVPAEQVKANDYNPNSVAPPEMELLRLSIMSDGYTQPIVAWPNDGFEVIDGFHRHRVGKELADVNARIHNHLPLAVIKEDREGRNDRIASTIRHNRARGKHKVDAMSDIVVELKRRNWSDERICRELGMDADEVLRLCQITGLAELFEDTEFSKSWDVEGAITEEDFQELTDDVSSYGEEKDDFRAVNTSDESRIFHTYEKWECYKAGFYATTAPEGLKKEDCENIYKSMLANIPEFEMALAGVISEWKSSCEHYLTNSAMNRIAWLGQASLCYAHKIPSQFRTGFSLLTEPQQEAANQIALVYLNKWLAANGREAVTMEQAYSGDRQSDIY